MKKVPTSAKNLHLTGWVAGTLKIFFDVKNLFLWHYKVSLTPQKWSFGGKIHFEI